MEDRCWSVYKLSGNIVLDEQFRFCSRRHDASAHARAGERVSVAAAETAEEGQAEKDRDRLQLRRLQLAAPRGYSAGKSSGEFSYSHVSVC